MGILSRGRELDNRVLGTSDSKRGWFANLFLGLNPHLFWVWVAAVVIDAVRVVVAVFDGGDWGGPLVSLVVSAVLAYASRGLPRRWERKAPR